MSVEFDPEWARFMLRLRTSARVMAQEQRQAMQAALLLVERDARANSPQDTRRLLGSITHAINQTPTAAGNIVLEGRVGPSVRYGAPVEFGRRPGRMPPPDALLGWVRRHWSPRGTTARAGRARNRAWGAREGELRSAAFVLARAIGRRGTPAQPYMRPAYTNNRVRIATAFRRVGLNVTAFLAGRRV